MRRKDRNEQFCDVYYYPEYNKEQYDYIEGKLTKDFDNFEGCHQKHNRKKNLFVLVNNNYDYQLDGLCLKTQRDGIL